MSLTVISAVSVVVAIALAAYAWRLHRLDAQRSAARVRALAAAIDGSAAGAPAMFNRAPESVVHGRPVLKVAIGFAMAVGIIVLIAMTGDRHASPSGSAPAGQAAGDESLQLLSMRHDRDGDVLKVTGLVRNPGTAPGPITAVVFAFDRDGSFVASGRAPLEFATIAAGDESPFQVTIPGVKDVGRYRVSFRTNDAVVRHVDRRPSLQVSN